MSEYYSAQAFLEAWWHGVNLAGFGWFDDGREKLQMPSTKYDLAPRYDLIYKGLGYLSSTESAFLVAMYSFYNSYAAVEMWGQISAKPLAQLASSLDEPRRRVIADLIVSYEGW